MTESALTRHRIISVTSRQIGHRYIRPVGRNSFRGPIEREGLDTVLVVETDRGATGWGLPLAGGDPSSVISKRVHELFDPAVGVIDDSALCLDFALHDLAGRILGLPVHAMLGGATHPVRCYSGGIYFDDLDPHGAPEGLAAVRRTIEQDQEFGFRDVKVKIGRGYRWMSATDGLQRDIEVTRLAREVLPEGELLVDANDAFSLHSVTAYLDAVQDCHLYWLEELFAERVEDLEFLRDRLADATHRPLVADGEYRPDLDQILELADRQLIDVALMDVMELGLTRWRRVMPALVAAGVASSPHAWGLPLKTLYAAHLAVGLGNVQIIEGVPAHTLGVDHQGFTLADGMLTLSDRPGFGLELIDPAG